MQTGPDQNSSINPVPQHFIPLRKVDLIDSLIAHHDLDPEKETRFRKLCTLVESIYHFEFHSREESLVQCYDPFNPDRDTQPLKPHDTVALQAAETCLVEQLRNILTKANFVEVTLDDLHFAMQQERFSRISLHIDLDDFDRLLVFWRGQRTTTRQIRAWGLLKRSVEAVVFDRVVVLAKFKDAAHFAAKKAKFKDIEPGSILIKLFKNVPRAELEMIFPNARVQFSLKDFLIFGGTMIGGGVGVILKAGAGLVAFGLVLYSLISSYLVGGQVRMPTATEMPQLVGGISALGIVFAFVWKQWNNYKNRKIRFMQILSNNLYFRNQANNLGVFHRLIYTAEAEEFKEAVLAYFFLWQTPDGLTATQLDQVIEQWFLLRFGLRIDFDIQDALDKLQALGICQTTTDGPQPVYTVATPLAACERMDRTWDCYF